MNDTATSREGSVETFRASVPGGCLFAWWIGTAFVLAVLVVGFVQNGGMENPGNGSWAFIAFAIPPAVAFVAPWFARRVRSDIRWARVDPTDGLVLSDGRTFSWADVRECRCAGPDVIVHVSHVGPVPLRRVRDGGRLAALVRRYAAQLSSPESTLVRPAP